MPRRGLIRNEANVGLMSHYLDSVNKTAGYDPLLRRDAPRGTKRHISFSLLIFCAVAALYAYSAIHGVR